MEKQETTQVQMLSWLKTLQEILSFLILATWIMRIAKSWLYKSFHSMRLQDNYLDLFKFILMPGDRVEVTGIYKTVPTMKSRFNGVFETVLIAIGITDLKIDLN